MKHTGDIPEDELIRRYFAPIAEDLGDDCASVRLQSGQDLLVSGDSFQEDIHFLRRNPADWVAYKAVAATVSDICASGGTPKWLILCLNLPRDLPLTWLNHFARGLERAMSDCGVRLIGGDTTASHAIGLSLTAMGTVVRGRRVHRSGAKPGDLIAVTGSLGEAHLGLQVVLGERDFGSERNRFWEERHFMRPFRGAFAIAAAEMVSAMMDLSDGLAADLPRLTAASGVMATIELDRLPLSSDSEKAGLGVEEAFRGGEDFELLAAVAPDRWQSLRDSADSLGLRLTRIGACGPGRGVSLFKNGIPVALEPAFWRHFT